MSRIFISHSSANNAEAIGLRDWLIAEGWDDLFLDLDPKRGIVAGERWERALNEAALRCEAVVFLVSKAWLRSGWCLKEFHLAAKLNKRIFGVLIEDVAIKALPAEVSATWQLVNLAGGNDHRMFRVAVPETQKEVHVSFSKSGLQKLKTGLTKAGLDPRFFDWPPKADPDRAPYRGMRALEAEDAGIFFGREAPIIGVLDRLRGLREGAAPRLLAILGASGAGKSSFLRAGLMPRLQRDDLNFYPLPILRPERAAITGDTGMIASLLGACKLAGLKQTRSQIREALAEGSDSIASLLHELTVKAKMAEPPIVVLAIDQAEELFLVEGGAEAKQLLQLLAELAIKAGPKLIVLFTIRSDSYERLQSATELEGLRQDTVSLPPLPKGAYQTVIEGPPQRLKDTPRALTIEPALTQQLLADIEDGGAKDALPLLAFTLERLYLEHGGDGDLKLSEYQSIGGIRGSIEAAVEQAFRAADKDPAIPRDHSARLTLLRRALIPWLAGIDPETGSPRRRIARLSEMPEEARPLVQHLIDQRLLATDVNPDTNERTIEPAHEALLRQWGRLQGWLEEDFAALSTVEGVKRAARDWAANDRDGSWLQHSAGRLEDAERLNAREDFAGFIDATDRTYLDACRVAETARKDKELAAARKLTRLTFAGAMVAAVLAVLAIGAAWYGFQQARIAEAQRVAAERNEAISLVALSNVAGLEGRPADAVRLVIAAWPKKDESTKPQLMRTLNALNLHLPSLHERFIFRDHSGHLISAIFSPDGARIATAGPDKTVRVWNPSTGQGMVVFTGHEDFIEAIAFSPDGRKLLTASRDGNAGLWDTVSGKELLILHGHTSSINSAVFSADGEKIVTASHDDTARVWNSGSGELLHELKGHESFVRSAVISPDGNLIATSSSDHTVRLWDARNGSELRVLTGHLDGVFTAAFSPNSKLLITASEDGTVRLWNAASGVELKKMHHEAVGDATFSPDGDSILTRSLDNTARIWDTSTGFERHVLRHDGQVLAATYSSDGTRVVTASSDNTARLWDAESGAQLRILKGHTELVTSADFSPDGKRVVTASFDGTARIWDVSTGLQLAHELSSDDRTPTAEISPDSRLIVTTTGNRVPQIRDAASMAVLHKLVGHSDNVNFAKFSPDGRQIITGSADMSAGLWNTDDGTQIRSLIGHTGEIYFGAFSPDGRHVLTAAGDRTTRVWEVVSGAELFQFKGYNGIIDDAAFSPDGTRIITTAWNEIRVWNAKTGDLTLAIPDFDETVGSFDLSSNGRLIVAPYSDGSVRVWDTVSGTEVRKLVGHTAHVYSAAFSPDGKFVVTASEDKTARIWDNSSGKELHVLRGHTESVYSARFSKDGNHVVTASGDNTARIWDSKSGVTLASMSAHKKPIYSVSLAANNKFIVTTSGDNTARIWDVSNLGKGDALQIACQRLGNNTDLADVEARYGLGKLPPICGEHAPLPVDFSKLE